MDSRLFQCSSVSLKFYSSSFQDTSGANGDMVGGLGYRAIVELIRTDNILGLRSFLETRHANMEDRDDVSAIWNQYGMKSEHQNKITWRFVFRTA